jgi:predicted CxxxxCH...CXXCH cytochrome family protein
MLYYFPVAPTRSMRPSPEIKRCTAALCHFTATDADSPGLKYATEWSESP